MGCVRQAGDRTSPARQAAIGGGAPVEPPALTLNRVCGAGAQAAASAATGITPGLVDCAAAGGMANADCAPYPMGAGAGAVARATR